MSHEEQMPLNTIVAGDCIAGMRDLPAGCVDLAFADPPFNIGYEYDIYRDRLACEQYLAWSRDWISGVYHALKPEGAFWLAIGDEYAAELKVLSREVGFHLRSWVIWYYTFGVNCRRKFSRSHAHLFYFVKDQERFTFLDEELENRIPSARQLVYNDKRSNPAGRLPDDTWIIPPGESEREDTWTLRPQDLEGCFQTAEDTWYFPRVAGTFKERAGFHGCQMPEQLLARILRCCSRPGERVLDPFSGSATTLAVAKKLGRQFLGFELSADYARHGQARLEGIRRGDRIEGAPEPLMSVPKTGEDKQAFARQAKGTIPAIWNNDAARERAYRESQLQLTIQGVREAFEGTRDGFSVDRVVADPELNRNFTERCRTLGLAGDVATWNHLLFRLRKRKGLPANATSRATEVTWDQCDPYLAASEMALQGLINDERASSLDEILCDPALAAEFDRLAQDITPGYSPLEYRWAALKIRKQAKIARGRGHVLLDVHKNQLSRQLAKASPWAELDLNQLPEQAGLYLLKQQRKVLYAGETRNLRRRLQSIRVEAGSTSPFASQLLSLGYVTKPLESSGPLAWQSCLVTKYNPHFNFHELRG